MSDVISNTRQQTSITEVLIKINILGIYCFENMAVMSTISKIFMFILIGVGLICYLSRYTKITAKKDKRINSVIFLSYAFVIYSFTLEERVQGEWSRLLGVNYQTAITILLATLVFFSVYSYIDDVEKLTRILRFITIAGVILAVEVVIICGDKVFRGLHSSGMTNYLSRYGLQSNRMGVYFSFASIFSMFFYLQNKSRKNLTILIVNLLFLILTGSRGALLSVIVGYGVMYILSGHKNNVIGHILMWSALMMGSFVLVMNVPFFYNLLGRRIESLLEVLNGGQGYDSTITRMRMINYAMDLIKVEPWHGYGFNAFSVFFGSKTGNQVYSHNNYMELMVSGGLFLIVLYYSRIIVVIKKLFTKRNHGPIVLTCLAVLFAVVVDDMVSVSYYYRIHYIVLAIVAACAFNVETDSARTSASLQG